MTTASERQVQQLTYDQFLERGRALSKEAGVLETLHGYFEQHAVRLYQCCCLFDLLRRPLGHVLEIGPFYGYTPFFLRENASSYSVLEGDDPAAHALEALYQKRSIRISYVDIFELFQAHETPSPLGFSNESFDSIICWETMEHFNFNPVPFVRELKRLLKPNGRIYITVPNKASFQNILALLSGRGEQRLIDAYYEYENYRSHGKNLFYGFHWREYSPGELRMLFAKTGLSVRGCDTFVSFQHHRGMSAVRHIVRTINRWVAQIFRRYGTHVFLVAEKEG